MAITAALKPGVGTERPIFDIHKPYVSEEVVIQGATAVAGDSVAYVPKFIKRVIGVNGTPYSYVSATNTLTLKSLGALGNDKIDITIYGYAF